jgi:hypothetical protein
MIGPRIEIKELPAERIRGERCSLIFKLIIHYAGAECTTARA